MNILLVDSDESVIQVLRERLDWELLGIGEVFSATDIRQAKEILQKESIQVMVCDIELSRGGGLDLLDWIRQEGFDVQTIFLTCYEQCEYAQRAIALKSLNYFMKPLDYGKLEAGISEAVQAAADREGRQCGGTGRERVWEGPEELSEPTRGPTELSEPESAGAKEQERGAVPPEAAEKPHAVVGIIRDYLDAHYQSEVSRSDLTELVYLNPDYISRLFKKGTGTSISSYLVGKRLDLAKGLLESTDLPVNAISHRVGYENYSYFCRMFKENTGCTPNEYRKKHGRTRG